MNIANFLTKNKRPTDPHFSIVDGNVLIDGEGRITSLYGMTSGIKIGSDGKYYFLGNGMMADANAKGDIFVYKYDYTTNEIEQEFRISIGFYYADSHRLPSFDIDSDGYIYIAFEELHSGDSHGGPIHLWKTDDPGDLSSLREIKRLPGRWSYPHVLVNGDNVFIEARGSTNETTFIRDEIWYYNSTNGGSTFGSAVKLYDAADVDLPAYTRIMKDFSDPTRICIILNERDNTEEEWGFVSLWIGLFGSDVWTNFQESFSKNVSSSGFLTRTETRTNCMIVDGESGFDIVFRGGIIDSSENPKIIVAKFEPTGNTQAGNPEGEIIELRCYFYDSGWDYNLIDIPSEMAYYPGYQRADAIVIKDGLPNDIIFIDRTNNNNVYRKRSSDNFATQEDSLVIAGNGSYRAGAAADGVLVLVDSDGNEFEFGPTETAADFSNLLIVKL